MQHLVIIPVFIYLIVMFSFSCLILYVIISYAVSESSETSICFDK
jgi:hypothetical protein